MSSPSPKKKTVKKKKKPFIGYIFKGWLENGWTNEDDLMVFRTKKFFTGSFTKVILKEIK